MSAGKSRTTLLLNWYANPYHIPIFVAKELGFYAEEGLQVAILEPNDPSDVTEIVGLGEVDFGLKAMIHTLAASVKGFDVVSIGTLLDEPPTGFISKPEKPVRAFEDLKGKRIGYIGHFGKVIIDDLCAHGGLLPSEYTTVRVGMHLTSALKRDLIDTGIGFINFQKVEIEANYGSAHFLRIDELAGLGCCCFCSVMYITNRKKLQESPERAEKLMRATQRAAAFTTENPEEAFNIFCQIKPFQNSELNRKIFYRSLPFFSRSLLNVERDWQKVGRYAHHLNIIPDNFDVSTVYTNAFLPKKPYCSTDSVYCAI